MIEKLKESLRTWAIDPIVALILGSAVATAIIDAAIHQYWSTPLQWRVVLTLSLFLLSYAGLLRFATVRGLGHTTRLLRGRISNSGRAAGLDRGWREMVADVHRTDLAYRESGDRRTIASIMEKRTPFLSLRPYLSDASKQAIWGRTFVVPPDQSTMSGTLHSILRDIDALEKEWGLR